MKPDLIVMDDIEGEVKIDQSRTRIPRMEDSEAPFSKRWTNAERRGYRVIYGNRCWRLKHWDEVIRVESMRRMTPDKVKRKALQYAIAHEILLRIKNDPKNPNPDALREFAKGNLGAWLSKRLDQALFTHLVKGHPISLRNLEDGTPEVKAVPIHDFYHRGEDASVDGAAPSGEIAN